LDLDTTTNRTASIISGDDWKLPPLWKKQYSSSTTSDIDLC